MIQVLTSHSESPVAASPAAALRKSGSEEAAAPRRLEAQVRPRAASAAAGSQTQSAVVEISSEGARRAQSAPEPALQSAPQALPQNGPQAPPLPAPNSPSVNPNATLDRAGTASAGQTRQPTRSAPLPEPPEVITTANSSSESSGKIEAPISLPGDAAGSALVLAAELEVVSQITVPPQYEDADTNKDGAIDVMERSIYDFSYPTLDGSSRKPAEAAPGRPLEGAEESVRRPAVAAELRAYAEVARGG